MPEAMVQVLLLDYIEPEEALSYFIVKKYCHKFCIRIDFLYQLGFI